MVIIMDKQAREARESVKKMSFPDKVKHFWYYNKVATIVIAVVVLTIAYSIYQGVTAEKYDLEIAYYGERSFTEEQIDAFKQYLSNFIEDIDGNGEKNVNFVVVTYAQGQSSGEYNMAIQQKFMAELSAGAYSAYIVSPRYFEVLSPESGNEVTESTFELNDSKALTEMLGESENEHWCTRALFEKEKKNEKSNLLYKNAKLAEKALLENK